MLVETVTFSYKVRKFLADLQKDVEDGNSTPKSRYTSFWLTLEWELKSNTQISRGFQTAARQLMCWEIINLFSSRRDIFPHFSQNYNQCLTQNPTSAPQPTIQMTDTRSEVSVCNVCNYWGCDIRIKGCGCHVHTVSWFSLLLWLTSKQEWLLLVVSLFWYMKLR